MKETPVTYSDDANYIRTNIGKYAHTLLRGINYTLGRLMIFLQEHTEKSDGQAELRRVINKLKAFAKKIGRFQQPAELIYWLETPSRYQAGLSDIKLTAIPKDLDKRIYNDFWSKSIPKILTSGTLAVGGDFSFAKNNLGLNSVIPYRLAEITKPSPFNYKEHCLMYISENVPFPTLSDNLDADDLKSYIKSIADEITRLTIASSGHTAVLFTSYKIMGAVFSLLHHKTLPYPLFKLNKSDPSELTHYRESRNGVLFAAGSFWEGIDIPGDILSSLIIVKLPFAAPDPINEYERSLCATEEEYNDKYIFSDMIIKLKQGVGRLIRSESDTGVISILDYRMRIGGKYRQKVFDALPEYQVTSKIDDIKNFLRLKKPGEFFS
jgi:ATP-dependent DNA helicase DinG